MPIDLVIDERDTKPEIGDTNNNSNGSSFCGGPPCVSRGLLDTSGGHSTDSASTPDQVIMNKSSCPPYNYEFSYLRSHKRRNELSTIY